ncbi:MAG TPA: protein kinase [Natronosporangium sp.]
MKPLRATDPPSIGEFRLVGRLGAGGMGQVYLGVTRSGRPVAVKLIRPEIAADPAFRARFVREVNAARQVGGFWTASVVAADPDAESPWLATEYVPGKSLHEAVAESGPLPPPTVRIVGARLAEALAAIHAAGLVHRDLKPANVLLAPDGPVVIDFGIARAFETNSALFTKVIGTPSYMSPEQIKGEPLTPASDVFSLGSTLVYALIGRGPFNTGAPEGIIFRVVAEPPDLTGVPADLAGLIASCLAKEPKQRPTTGQLLAALGPPDAAVVDPYGGWQPPAHDPLAGLPAAATEPLALAGSEPTQALPATRKEPSVYYGLRPAGHGPGRRVARHLQAGEQFRTQWRPHPIRLLPAVAAAAGATLLLALLAGFAVNYLAAGWFATIPTVIWIGVLAWLLWRIVEWRGERVVLTDRRLLLLGGGTAVAVPLAVIAGVSTKQPALGRLFGFGTVRLTLAGKGVAPRDIRWLPNPAGVHRLLTDALR